MLLNQKLSKKENFKSPLGSSGITKSFCSTTGELLETSFWGEGERAMNSSSVSG